MKLCIVKLFIKESGGEIIVDKIDVEERKSTFLHENPNGKNKVYKKSSLMEVDTLMKNTFPGPGLSWFIVCLPEDVENAKLKLLNYSNIYIMNLMTSVKVIWNSWEEVNREELPKIL